MEMHFIAIPLASYLKARKSRALESIFYLTGLEIPEGANPDSLRDVLWEEVRDDEGAEQELEHLQHLVQVGALPADDLSLHRSQYEPLMELFDAAPTAFGKCFSGGEQIGTELDAIWGDDVQRISAALAELEVNDEELQAAVEWLRELYSRAAQEDWVLLRYMA
jgi:hypothetical protein